MQFCPIKKVQESQTNNETINNPIHDQVWQLGKKFLKLVHNQIVRVQD